MALVPGVRPILELGGRVFTDLSNLKTLVGTVGAQNNTTLRAYNATTGYQVTTGKTLRLSAGRLVTWGAIASNVVSVGYADADIGVDTTTAFTNPVYPGGNASNGVIFTTETDGYATAAFNADMAAQKYPFMSTGGSPALTLWVFGYEV